VEVRVNIPRAEYPRPDLRRPDWRNLNGEWEFAFSDREWGHEHEWPLQGPFNYRILVPFPFEASLSGIGDPTAHPAVWYRHVFQAQKPQSGQRLQLHFGAVDYDSAVWLNGQLLGTHRGGYTPFSFDVTNQIAEGENTLIVGAADTLSLDQPRGKQYWGEHPTGIWYDRTSGIWQTVWLEPTPASFIRRLHLTPDLDAGTLHVRAEVDGDAGSLALLAVALDCGQEVARAQSVAGEVTAELRLRQPRPWSPESPHLYDLRVSLLRGEHVVDHIHSYFGLRKIAREGRDILLNNQPYYQRLVLDQGYWPNGQYTAPNDDALRADILWAKRYGYNGARKHQKLEDPRWLYWCDRLGFLAWEEMPGCGLYYTSPQAIANTKAEWQEALVRDYNHPSIAVLMPFNESWGIWGVREDPAVQAGVRDVVEMTHRMDPTRLVVDNSGWEHLDTDIADVHTYLGTGEQLQVWWPCYRAGQTYIYDSHHPFWATGYHYESQPVIFSEYGGMAIEGFPPPEDKPLQSCGLDSPARFLSRYHDLTRAILDIDDVCGFCFTQLTDVEGEVNGVLTYDRRPKVDPAAVASYNQEAPARYPIGEKQAEKVC
jgi:beta-galactosidase/beta-glucuronidase